MRSIESILRPPLPPIARLILIAATTALTAPASLATRYFVDASALAGGNGLSWTSALNSLDAALNYAGAGDEVWVMEGTYVPRTMTAPPDLRSSTFWVHAGVSLYGGFLGIESSLPALGNPRATVLDGNIQDPSLATDNCLHVVTIRQAQIGNGPTVVDGFVIRNGYSAGDGAGLVTNNGSLALSRCCFVDNHARTGAALWWQLATVRMKYCTFARNNASVGGGALYARTTSPMIFNCRFIANTADQYGGALLLESIGATTTGGDPEPYARFVNCLFARNWAPYGGAAFLGSAQYNSGKAKWLSCTFVENSARFDGATVYAAIGGLAAVSVIRNSIVWSSVAPTVPHLGGRFHYVRYSDVQQTAWTGVSADNLNIAPGFTSLYSLAAGSLLIDRGNADYVPADDTDLDGDGATANQRCPYDLAGHSRTFDDPATANAGAGFVPYLDIGAFEAQ